MTRTTKIFNHGKGQAVRIPEDLHFKTAEVWIRRDERNGDIILSPHAESRELPTHQAASRRIRNKSVVPR